MNKLKHFSLITLFLTAPYIFSQERNWTYETSKDGKSSVKYDLVNEEKGTHFYFIAQTTTNVSLQELNTYFSNTENHKYFLERTTVTEEVKKISDKQWIAYYFFDAPWPLPDSDIVIEFNKIEKNNKLIFTANRIANDFKKTDIERMKNYKVSYEFEKINDVSTKITYNADYIPVGSVPKFLIKTWFPDGPINIIKNLGNTKKHN